MQVFTRYSLLACLILWAAGAASQGYPSKPVRLVVPYAAGGGADTTARAIAQKYTDQWKQPILVENRGGAGGNIGTEVVARAAPDGYTLLFHTNALAISPALYRKLPFDPLKDLVPATLLSSSTIVLVTTLKSPVTSVAELVSQARAQPGKLNFGSSGAGGPVHLAMEMLKISAGIDLVHIPYKGDAQTVPALMAGEIHVTFMPISAGLPHIRGGRFRALAVTGPSRSPALPDVPTMIEAGWKDVELLTWLGLFAPGGTPRDILARISADGMHILQLPEVVKMLQSSGLDPVGTTPEQFAALYRADIAKYSRIIREAGVPLMD